jgi:hypothetical protein
MLPSQEVLNPWNEFCSAMVSASALHIGILSGGFPRDFIDCWTIPFSRNVRFEVFTAVTMKNDVFWEEDSFLRGPSIIKVTRIGELGTTLAVTGNRRTPRRNTK